MTTTRTGTLVVALGLMLALGGCASGYAAKATGTDRMPFLGTTPVFAEVADPSAGYADIRNDSGASAASARKVIRSADLRLLVDDADEAGRAIRDLAESSGGFVLSSSRLRYQIKVPATGLDSVVDRIETLGEVDRRSFRGEDVTAEYVDLEVRLANAHAARRSYEALLGQAKTVAEVLEVEKALHEVQERIELLEGRRKFLDEHLALSDVDVSLREVEAPGPLQLVWKAIAWTADLLW